MKLEIGGGTPDKIRGGGWLSIDQVTNADIRHDLNVTPWPLEDDSVDELYSSHCLEHLNNPMAVLHEIVRIGKVGCPVEIRVPHPISDLAMVSDHKHVFSPVAAINADVHFARDHWKKPKRLKLDRIDYHASFLLDEAKRELPFLAGLSDEVIMKWIPRTCHECVFYYRVAVNEFA